MNKNKIIYALSLFFLGLFFLNSILDALIDSENIILYSIGLLVCEFIILIPLYIMNKKDILKMFKDFKINYQKYLKKVFLIWIIGFIIMMLLNFIINYLILPVSSLSSNEELTRNLIFKYPIYGIISTCLLVPLIEEFTFRLSMSNIKNKYFFIFLASIIFAVLHVLPDLNNLKVLYFFPYTIIGLTFTFIFYKTKNIFTSIVIHSLHNITTLLLIIIF